MSKIINSDALDALRKLPDSCCRTCITSPPYYGLRDYGADGQIGLEDTPDRYIENLVRIFREVRRVLKDDGTLWVNIGDSYAASGKGRNRDGVFNEKAENIQSARQKKSQIRRTTEGNGLKRKDLIGIPWLLAFALRADGWYLRSDIIWQKPNAMPESVKDRPTRAHEYIFLLSKSSRYYYDAEAVKEPAVGFYNAAPAGSAGTGKPNARRRGNSRTFRGGGAYTHDRAQNNSATVERESHGLTPNESGKRNRRSVWTIATRPYKGVAFVEKTPEPMRPLRPPNRQGQFLACYTKAGQPDFKGTLTGGRAVVFEAKHTDSDRIDYNRLTQEQLNSLAEHDRLGAAAFILVSVELQDFYRVPWSVWRDMRKLYGHKHMNKAELEPFRVQYIAGVLKLMEGIELEYGEQEETL